MELMLSSLLRGEEGKHEASSLDSIFQVLREEPKTTARQIVDRILQQTHERSKRAVMNSLCPQVSNKDCHLFPPEDLKFDIDMTEKDRHTAGKTLALMAALAYERPKRFDALLKEKEGDAAFFACVDSEENEVMSSQDFFVEGAEDVDLKPMEAFLVRKDERSMDAVLVFRGTEPFQTTDFELALTAHHKPLKNAPVSQEKEVEAHPKRRLWSRMVPASSKSEESEEVEWLHDGFYSTLLHYWPSIEKMLKSAGLDAQIDSGQERRLFICGHGIGGALALCLTAHLIYLSDENADYFKKVITGVYTFGSPRMSSPEVAKVMSETLPDRIVNYICGDEFSARFPPKDVPTNLKEWTIASHAKSGKVEEHAFAPNAGIEFHLRLKEIPRQIIEISELICEYDVLTLKQCVQSDAEEVLAKVPQSDDMNSFMRNYFLPRREPMKASAFGVPKSVLENDNCRRVWDKLQFFFMLFPSILHHMLVVTIEAINIRIKQIEEE